MGEIFITREDTGEVLLDIRKVTPEKRSPDGTLSTGEAARGHYVEFDNLGTEKK